MKKFTIFAAILIFSLGLARASDAKEIVVDCDKGQNPEDVLETIAQGRGVDVVLKGNCGSEVPIFWHIEKDDIMVTGSTDDDEDGCPDPLPTFNGTIVLHHVNRVELSCLKITGPGPGVEAYGSNFWIYHSEISGNGGVGLHLNWNSSAYVSDSDITNNAPFGILMMAGSSIELHNVHVNSNTGVGISLERNSNAVITGNLIDSTIKNNTDNGIWIETHSFVQVYGGKIEGNGNNSIPEIQLRRDAGLVLNGGYVSGGTGHAIFCDSESRWGWDGGIVTPSYWCSTF